MVDDAATETEKDDLLPLLSRRAYKRDVVRLAEDATEQARLCLIFIDIDHFKKVNDTHDHTYGDKVLIGVSEIINACLKGKGQAYRVGGEEIVLPLPNYSNDEGIALAERIRREIEVKKLTDKQLSITVSIGLAFMPPASGHEDLYRKADKAMLEAKKDGRNRLRVYGEQKPKPQDSRQRKPKRKEVETGFSEAEMEKIRQDYFRTRLACCPKDGGILKIIVDDEMSRDTPGLWVSCPLCGTGGTC